MEKLLNRILWKKKNRGGLILGTLGFLVGIVMFLLCIQLYLDMNYLFNTRLALEKQLDYLIISKRISPETLLSGGGAGFSAEEIESIKKKPFTLDMGQIKANRFAASAGVDILGMGFTTELFFESVPDRFLDFIPEKWGWKEGDRTVPVMLSRDFLLLYNFGFSQARGFPLLSEEMIGMIPMRLKVAGRGGSMDFTAKIAGLSDRIASILVPDTFMEWANNRYGNDSGKTPSRLILSVKDRSDPAIVRFVEEQGYETSKEKLRLSDAGFTIKIVLSAIAAVAVLLILLSFILFLSTFKLVVAGAKSEIILLTDLGYTGKRIMQTLMKGLAFLLGALLLGAMAVVIMCVLFLHLFLSRNGFAIPGLIHPLLPVTGIVLTAVVYLLNRITIERYITGQQV